MIHGVLAEHDAQAGRGLLAAAAPTDAEQPLPAEAVGEVSLLPAPLVPDHGVAALRRWEA
ncbi:MAG TPA: hypothetical protein VHO29_17195 [Marmoricola sp.]|nr:hypothetical protein [Marmoricola sp.]